MRRQRIPGPVAEVYATRLVDLLHPQLHLAQRGGSRQLCVKGTRVFGQDNFTTTFVYDDALLAANLFYVPYAACLTAQGMFVADSDNNRVLVWNKIPIVHNFTADVVLGQPNLNSRSASFGDGTATMFRPVSAFNDGKRLFVSDRGNSRVLIWNSIPKSNFQSADLVLGQADFMSVSPNRGGGAAANTLDSPGALYFDGTKLFVADFGNNRVLIWNSLPSSNGLAANVVVGQSNMTGNVALTPVTASRTNWPAEKRQL